ncbi:MAG: hypothetical protein Q9169_008051 [Polycauliona sp. 2 TL-2023]
MYILGDKYGISGLRSIAATKFDHQCYYLSSDLELHPDINLNSLLDVVPLLYTHNQAHPLRLNLVEALAHILNMSLRTLKTVRYVELFKNYPDFAFETMTASMVAAHSRKDDWSSRYDAGWDPDDPGVEKE